jgi:hypothetical protein
MRRSLFSAAPYFKGIPRSQWGGTVVVIHVKGPSSARERPHNSRESYSLIKLTCASCNKSDRSFGGRPTPSRNPIPPRSGQVKGAEERRASVLPPFAIAKFGPITSFGNPEFFTRAVISHMMFKFENLKSALLFSVWKGISNAAPNEGGPGEKAGSVGHGGPQTPYMPLTKPTTATRKPNATLATSHRRRCIRTWGIVGFFCCWADGSLGVALILGLSLTENAPVFCGSFGGSATIYLTTEKPHGICKPTGRR